ncbi:MAG TPA: lipocalin-like domain-containing protein [Candidatus Dormibacteraeota bacterium]|nr:lipocalin-like domain-containing protein [Candidatus Dormibacteraeota bacterium]
MDWRNILSVSVMTGLGFALLAGNALAQQKTLKKQLVATWTVVAVDNVRLDGSKFQAFGPNPKGILMFDANGRFSFQLARSGRPKFASDKTVACWSARV